MKENVGDLVLGELSKRRDTVRKALSEKYKKTKPFHMEPVDNDMLLYIYDNMTEEDVRYGVQTYGYESMNQWIMDMEKTKQRRGM